MSRLPDLVISQPSPFPQQLGTLVFPQSRLSPGLDNVYQWENRADSTYSGMSLSLNRRLANEIEFSTSYTLSKAIDDASDFDEQPQNPYLIRAESALSANDQRHRFVFSGTFDLPIGEEEEGRKSSGPLSKLFGNIEVAPILAIGSGRPVNPLTGFDANYNGAFPLSSRPFGFSRNSLTTLKLAQRFASAEVLPHWGAWEAGLGGRVVQCIQSHKRNGSEPVLRSFNLAAPDVRYG